MLGQGGMGTVWRAEHIGLGAPVAVKLIDPKLQSSPEAFRQCQKEARAAAALRSPHVVQVLDFGMDDASGSPFIVMELLEGESLADRLRRTGVLGTADAARVVTHVARALSRAHEAGIVHRDLKPANVFLVHNEDEEMAKVLDFGTARVQPSGNLGDTTTPTGLVVGTPYYMSPEHITGSRIDHRTDLWALGVMVYECLLGRRPFEATEIGQLVLQICTYPMPRPSAVGPVPAGLDAWFARATERDVGRRFQSARELADELRRVCEGTAYAPSRTPLHQPATMPMSSPADGAGPPSRPGARTVPMTPPTTGVFTPPASAPVTPVLPRPRRARQAAVVLVLGAGAIAGGLALQREERRPPAAEVAAPAAAAPPTAAAPPVAPAPRAPSPAAPPPAAPVALPAPPAAGAPAAAKGGRKRKRRAPASPPPSQAPAPATAGSEPHRTPPTLESVLDQRR